VGGLDIVGGYLIAHLKLDCRRIVVAAATIIHGDDAGLQIGTIGGDRTVQLGRESGYSAAAWEMITNESDAPKWVH
jgi:hypothetical protein